MNEFPGITHVAVTVSDLARSTAWYADLFGSAPVLDEDVEAGAFHHTVFALGGGNLFGLHQHTEPGGRLSTSAARASTTSRSRAPTATSSRAGSTAWTSSAPARRGRRRPLRVGTVVPRPRRHRAGVLRPARCLTRVRPRNGGRAAAKTNRPVPCSCKWREAGRFGGAVAGVAVDASRTRPPAERERGGVAVANGGGRRVRSGASALGLKVADEAGGASGHRCLLVVSGPAVRGTGVM